MSAALKQPVNGFHTIEFAPGDSPGKIVLDGATLAVATERVLKKYGIQQDRMIVTVAK